MIPWFRNYPRISWFRFSEFGKVGIKIPKLRSKWIHRYGRLLFEQCPHIGFYCFTFYIWMKTIQLKSKATSTPIPLLKLNIGKHGNQTLPEALFDKITSSLITLWVTLYKRFFYNKCKRRDKPGLKMRDVCAIPKF